MERIGDRYEIVREIGRGGCAFVYAAFDTWLGRQVALKVANESSSNPGVADRLVREGRVAASICHPNVCAVLDAGVCPDGAPYLVMERLMGETLGARLRRCGRLDVDTAIDVAVQLLSALDAAHRAGFVHRDVKPDNVYLVARRGCRPLVKLLDFGLCCREGVHDDVELTIAGTVVGTPEYMSPEQALGMRIFDRRSDLFAVGLVLYESLTGVRAFAGGDTAAVLSAVIDAASPSMVGVPLELRDVLAAVLARDPFLRPGDARELQEELLVAVSDGSGAFLVPELQRVSHAPHRSVEGASEHPTRRLVG